MCFRARLLEVDGGGHEGLALLEHGQRVLAAPRLIAVHLQEVALREVTRGGGRSGVLPGVVNGGKAVDTLQALSV